MTRANSIGRLGVYTNRGLGIIFLPAPLGQIWASSRELAYLLDNFLQTPPARTLSENCSKLLTQREQAVVQLVADGMSNREIAAQLKLSQHTVKNYLFRVFDKIGVSSRVELVLCALTSPMADPTLAPHCRVKPRKPVEPTRPTNYKRPCV